MRIKRIRKKGSALYNKGEGREREGEGDRTRVQQGRE